MSAVLTVIEIIGVFSFSISGALMAIDKENDFFGVIFLAVITSFGGGMMRDIFIGNTPPAFFGMTLLVTVSVITATAVFLLAAIFKKQYVKHEKFIQTVNNYFDAAGLGVFVISGAKICIDLGYTNPFLIIIMGMLSGTGGSMTRDIIMNVVPGLLRKYIYMIAALAGATVYYLLNLAGVPDIIAVPTGAVLIFVIRICATVFRWNMPKAIKFSEMTGNDENSSCK